MDYNSSEVLRSLRICFDVTDGTKNCSSCSFNGQPYCANKLLEEVEIVFKENDNLYKQLEEKCSECVSLNNSLAIKEFAERLKEQMISSGEPWDEPMVYEFQIDNLVKEMVGDTE